MQRNINNEQKGRIPLLQELEEKKSLYKKTRRPLTLYVLGISIVLTFIILAIIVIGVFGGNTYVGGWAFFVIIVCGLVFLGLLISFFPGDAFNGLDRIRNLTVLKDEVETLQMRLRLLEELQIQQSPLRQRYRDELVQTIFQYQRQANGYRRTHYTLQILIILLSLFVTTLTSGLANLLGFADKQWITASVSFSVSFLTAMTALFRFHDRAFNLQQTADAVEYEIKNADLQIYDYGPPLSEDEVLRKLAERGAKLLDEQRKRQLQLEQASNTKHTSE